MLLADSRDWHRPQRELPAIPAAGVRVVPLGRIADVTGYVGRGVRHARHVGAVIVAGDITRVHHDSTLTAPATDLEAFNHGFVAVTPLVPDLTLAAALDASGSSRT
jgi:hypothetical protein